MINRAVQTLRACIDVTLIALLATSAVPGRALAQNVTTRSSQPIIPKKGDIGYYNGLALTPTMGLSTWNGYGCPWITEELIKATARAMVSSGLRDAGYVYVNLDDCWQKGRDQHLIACAGVSPTFVDIHFAHVEFFLAA